MPIISEEDESAGRRIVSGEEAPLEEMGRRIVPEELMEQYYRDTGVEPGTPDSTEARTMEPEA